MTKTIGLLILFNLIFSTPSFAKETNPSNLCLFGNKIMFTNQEACVSQGGENCSNNLIASFVKEMEYIHINQDQYVLRAYLNLEASELPICAQTATHEDYKTPKTHRMAYPEEFELIKDLLSVKQPFLGVIGSKPQPSQSLSDLNFEIVDSAKITNASSHFIVDEGLITPAGGEFAGGGIMMYEHRITIPKEEVEKHPKQEDDSEDNNDNSVGV